MRAIGTSARVTMISREFLHAHNWMVPLGDPETPLIVDSLATRAHPSTGSTEAGTPPPPARCFALPREPQSHRFDWRIYPKRDAGVAQYESRGSRARNTRLSAVSPAITLPSPEKTRSSSGSPAPVSTLALLNASLSAMVSCR